MRLLILITFITIHQARATIPVQKIRELANYKLQTLADSATNTLHHVTQNINLEKLDFLQLIPRLKDRLNGNQPSHLDKIKFYIRQVQNLNGKDVMVALEALPVWRMDVR
ncbi:hypothetical protein K1T71_012457 [Dendrolimus kikuchii]|uniref:Uncharacterized protein n=1 Tax=Dendrolimus kikuchii TaxID=765133 RepID=A0ACC1CJE0_9NEOP|nr:hypothetical protein K1T71_012457 [Dendrolimus kikuchii]